MSNMHNKIDTIKTSESELKKTDEMFRSMASLVKDAIIVLDNDGNISFWNKAAKRIFGYLNREALGKECHLLLGPECFYEDYRKGFSKFKGSGKGPVIGKTLELTAVKKNGTEFPIELSVSAVKLKGTWNAIGIIRDITERKEMQEKLVRQEKLAAMGQLAGGVAHELRNPLGAIKNAAFFLNMALEKPNPEIKETLEMLEKEAAISEGIIRSLLGFARPKPPVQHKVDVNEVIDEVLSRNAIPQRINVVIRLTKTMPSVMADPEQLSQIFRNLILNAVQAMPEGGDLTIKSKLDRSKRAEISFTDTGKGIPEEIIGKLFEPLFTTKAKGIGLGLAVTKTLVEAHGGTVEAKSEAGKGSTFTVKLSTSSNPG